jgi:hypothetical protein
MCDGNSFAARDLQSAEFAREIAPRAFPSFA